MEEHEASLHTLSRHQPSIQGAKLAEEDPGTLIQETILHFRRRERLMRLMEAINLPRGFDGASIPEHCLLSGHYQHLQI